MNRRVDFDDFTENYNQLLHEKTRFFSSGEEYFARYKVDLVRERASSPVSRLLEYGCGIGRNISFLQKAFPNAIIVGSDVSGASLEVARRLHAGVEFVQENENADSIGQFDVIFVAGVFHHVPIEQRVDVARVLSKRLLPGGSLFVFEHNPFNPVTRRIVNNCPYDTDAVLLKLSELESILRRVSLTIENKAYCLFVPPRLSILGWLEGKLGWLPLGGQYWVQAKLSL
jgi:SAM-dependent methyltransferase